MQKTCLKRVVITLSILQFLLHLYAARCSLTLNNAVKKWWYEGLFMQDE